MKYTYTCTEVNINCDNCDNDAYERTGDLELTVSGIYKRLRSEGWKLGKKDLCPKCSGKVIND